MTWANSYIYAAEDLPEVEVPERPNTSASSPPRFSVWRPT